MSAFNDERLAVDSRLNRFLNMLSDTNHKVRVEGVAVLKNEVLDVIAELYDLRRQQHEQSSYDSTQRIPAKYCEYL
jgi:hypothetical protein